MYFYPATLTPDDNGTVMVTFDDVPEATSFGDDDADALANGRDALETALGAYILDRRDIPAPSDGGDRPTVGVSLLAQLKLVTYEAMRKRGWRKADLARAMGLNPRQIDRLLDLRHVSTIPQLEQALTIASEGEVEVRQVGRNVAVFV